MLDARNYPLRRCIHTWNECPNHPGLSHELPFADSYCPQVRFGVRERLKWRTFLT
jgi:hypothetical protein